jgi:hypothetical protein
VQVRHLYFSWRKEREVKQIALWTEYVARTMKPAGAYNQQRSWGQKFSADSSTVHALSAMELTMDPGTLLG